MAYFLTCYGTGKEKELKFQWSGKCILGTAYDEKARELRAKLDKVIEEFEATPPWETEKLIKLAQEYSLIWAQILPGVTTFAHLFYTDADTYCWENWPTYPDYYYMDPATWWNHMLFIILQLRPTGRCPTKEATMPSAPPKLPIEIQKPAPTSL